MGGRALAQFLLQHCKLGIRDPRHLRRLSGTQGLRTTLPPSPTPAFHRTLAHPQLFRDHRGLLTRREPPTGLQPHLFTKRPPLSSQAPPSGYRISPAYRRDHQWSPPDDNAKTSVSAGHIRERASEAAFCRLGRSSFRARDLPPQAQAAARQPRTSPGSITADQEPSGTSGALPAASHRLQGVTG